MLMCCMSILNIQQYIIILQLVVQMGGNSANISSTVSEGDKLITANTFIITGKCGMEFFHLDTAST